MEFTYGGLRNVTVGGILSGILALLLATPAYAITNGTAEIAWDNNLPAGATIELQYTSYADATWKPFVYGTPTLGTDGKMKVMAQFTPFPPDNLTDHFMCIRARTNLNGQSSPWTAEAVCNQVPVSKPVVIPPAPSGLELR